MVRPVQFLPSIMCSQLGDDALAAGARLLDAVVSGLALRVDDAKEE